MLCRILLLQCCLVVIINIVVIVNDRHHPNAYHSPYKHDAISNKDFRLHIHTHTYKQHLWSSESPGNLTHRKPHHKSILFVSERASKSAHSECDRKPFMRFASIQIEFKWIILQTLKNQSSNLNEQIHFEHFKRIFYVFSLTMPHEYKYIKAELSDGTRPNGENGNMERWWKTTPW